MKYLKYSICSLILFVLVQPLGALNFSIKLFFTFISFYLLAFVAFNKLKSINYFMLFLALVIPILIALLYFNGLNYSYTWISLPSNLSAIMAIVAAYFQNNSNKIIRFFNPWLWIIVLFIYIVWGNSLWIKWNNFGVLKFAVNERVPVFNAFNNFYHSRLNNDSLNHQISVFDFWNTSCGVCFEKFPMLDSLQRKYGETGIKFYAVNVPLNRDQPGKADSMINKYNYSFQKINLTSSALADSFKIRVYPTTLVIDQNKEIIYRGSIDELDDFLQVFKMRNSK